MAASPISFAAMQQGDMPLTRTCSDQQAVAFSYGARSQNNQPHISEFTTSSFRQKKYSEDIGSLPCSAGSRFTKEKARQKHQAMKRSSSVTQIIQDREKNADLKDLRVKQRSSSFKKEISREQIVDQSSDKNQIIQLFDADSASKYIFRLFKARDQNQSNYVEQIGQNIQSHWRGCCSHGRCGQHAHGIRCMSQQMLICRAFSGKIPCRDLLINIYDFIFTTHSLIEQVVSFFFFFDNSVQLEKSIEVLSFCLNWMEKRPFTFANDHDLLLKIQSFLAFLRIRYYSLENTTLRKSQYKPSLLDSAIESFIEGKSNKNANNNSVSSRLSISKHSLDVIEESIQSQNNLPTLETIKNCNESSSELSYRSEKRRGAPPKLSRTFNSALNCPIKKIASKSNPPTFVDTPTSRTGEGDIIQARKESADLYNSPAPKIEEKTTRMKSMTSPNCRKIDGEEEQETTSFTTKDCSFSASSSEQISRTCSKEEQPSQLSRSLLQGSQKEILKEQLRLLQNKINEIENVLQNSVLKESNKSCKIEEICKYKKEQINKQITFQNGEFNWSDLFSSFDISAICQQLCLIEENLYGQLNIEELFSESRTKRICNNSYNTANGLRCSDHKKTLNSLKRRINQFTYFLILLFLLQENQTKRFQLYQQLLELSKAALEVHNYSLALQIYFCFNSQPLVPFMQPLIEAQTIQDKIKRKRLNQAIDFEKSFTSLKSSMVNQQPPMIPALNIITRDLALLDQHREDYYNDTPIQHLDVVKFQEISKLVGIIYQIKQHKYGFVKINGLFNFLNHGFEAFMQKYIDLSDPKIIDIKFQEFSKKLSSQAKGTNNS